VQTNQNIHRRELQITEAQIKLQQGKINLVEVAGDLVPDFSFGQIPGVVPDHQGL
jgi:hypothetical protein